MLGLKTLGKPQIEAFWWEIVVLKLNKTFYIECNISKDFFSMFKAMLGLGTLGKPQIEAFECENCCFKTE